MSIGASARAPAIAALNARRLGRRPPTADRFDLFDYRSVPFPLGFLCRRGTTFRTREGQSGGKGTGGGRRGAVEWLGPRAALDVPPPHPPPSTRRATSRPLGRSCAPTAAWLGAQTGPHPLFDAIASPRPYPGRTTPAAGSDAGSAGTNIEQGPDIGPELRGLAAQCDAQNAKLRALQKWAQTTP